MEFTEREAGPIVTRPESSASPTPKESDARIPVAIESAMAFTDDLRKQENITPGDAPEAQWLEAL